VVVLLSEQDWMQWFDLSCDEAPQLVAVQRELRAAHIVDPPHLVIGMSHFVSSHPEASDKLQHLADLWDGRDAGVQPGRLSRHLHNRDSARHHRTSPLLPDFGPLPPNDLIGE